MKADVSSLPAVKTETNSGFLKRRIHVQPPRNQENEYLWGMYVRFDKIIPYFKNSSNLLHK